VKAVIFNAIDYVRYLGGELRIEDVSKVEVEALIDTGAIFQRYQRILSLSPDYPRSVNTWLKQLKVLEE